MSGGPTLAGQGATDYERYLNVATLLSAKKPKDKLAHRDEHLFQVVHQAAELWFEQIRFDIEETDRLIANGNASDATRLVRRMVEVVRLLTESVNILTTMNVWDYHDIRLALGKGSGQESPGFNGILREAPKLERTYLDLLQARGVTLYDVCTGRGAHAELLALGDALVDFDMRFHLWRQNHLAFVKRMIGPGQRSLKGYGVDALEKHILGQFFYLELLAVRDEMTLKAGTSPPGKPPEATRTQPHPDTLPNRK
ncbi:MAG TPA: tryptophan 2,3-dioxygenase family protein [Candidatus Thermoplasmatota archaeon]|nr:tryptophan 2,3-dioxygenase family protein [Candidatus Thermoplasmatota archaeon]